MPDHPDYLRGVASAPDAADPSATVPFEGDAQLTRAIKRVVRTAVGPRVGQTAVARIAAGLVQAVAVLRDEAVEQARKDEHAGDDLAAVDARNLSTESLIAELGHRVLTPIEAARLAVTAGVQFDPDGLNPGTHGVNLARRLLGLFHAERVSARQPGESTRTQMVARLELTDFTDRMNDLVAIEREVTP